MRSTTHDRTAVAMEKCRDHGLRPAGTPQHASHTPALAEPIAPPHLLLVAGGLQPRAHTSTVQVAVIRHGAGCRDTAGTSWPEPCAHECQDRLIAMTRSGLNRACVPGALPGDCARPRRTMKRAYLTRRGIRMTFQCLRELATPCAASPGSAHGSGRCFRSEAQADPISRSRTPADRT